MDTFPASEPMENPPHSPLGGLDPANLLKQGAAEDTFMDVAATSFSPPPIEELAAIFPQFEILELIGKGGMGAVYKVRQKDLDRMVALKILPPAIGQSPEFSMRFTREARALAKLNHPGIVTLHEFGQAGGLYFILMEFVDGVNLAQLMKTGRISPREALAIVPQICDALQFAHDQGIVHRDIKPENILLDRLGRVKVADFGIAKVVAAVSDPIRSGDIPVPENQTLSGKVIGTPQYMAPEQIDHPSEVDHRADIYALGVVFYQMLTGELPGKRLEAPSKKVHIDVRLDEIVLKAMEKNPELRYQQASVMRTRVDRIAEESSPTPPIVCETIKDDLRMPAVCLGIVGAIFIGLAGAGVLQAVLWMTVWQDENAFGKVGFTSMSQAILPLVVGLVIGAASRAMRRVRGYGMSVVGCILALFTVIGTPFGIWGMILLARREVRRAFESSESGSPPQAMGAPNQDSEHGTQVDSFSIASFLLAILLGPLGSLPAIIFGHVSLSRIRANPLLTGRGFAVAGLIIGYLFLAASIALIALAMVFYGRTTESGFLPSSGEMPFPTPRAIIIEEPPSPPSSSSVNPILLMTEFGEFKSEQSLWSIRVSSQNRTLHISRQPGSSGIGTSISPSKWRAQKGWFAFVEDEHHAWAYDGSGTLMLVEVTPEKSTLYETETILRTVPDTIQPLISKSTLGRMGAKSVKPPDAGKTEIGGPEVAVLAERWLTGIDSGNYDQSWKNAAKFFQTSITETAWSEALAKVRKPLGEMKSRKLLHAKSAKSLPGAPDGEYVVMQFETSFTAKEKAVETATFTKEADGSWKCSGYFIK